MVGIATLTHGGDRVSEQAANLPLATQAGAAEMLNVSERSVRSACSVIGHDRRLPPVLAAGARRNRMNDEPREKQRRVSRGQPRDQIKMLPPEGSIDPVAVARLIKKKIVEQQHPSERLLVGTTPPEDRSGCE